MDAPLGFIHPSRYDVMITDIFPSDIDAIGRELGVIQLSPHSGEFTFPVNGVMYGQNLRIFAPFVVRKKEVVITVFFLYDTGSPQTFLRRETFEALGFTDSIPSSAMVKIHGITLTVCLSQAHFSNVDVLGQDFCSAARLNVTSNYVERVVLFQ
jgi:hypothetical protein